MKNSRKADTLLDSKKLLKNSDGLFAKLFKKADGAAVLQDVNKSENIVYRAINTKDYQRLSQGLDLEAKSPKGNWSLKEHIVNGSGKKAWDNDPYISTTLDLDVARGFNATGDGLGIVAIDLNKLNSTHINKGYEIFPRVNGAEGLPYYYSVWQQEVSVYQSIPRDAIVNYIK